MFFNGPTGKSKRPLCFWKRNPPALYDELWWKWSRNSEMRESSEVYWANVMEKLAADPSIAKYSDEERQGMHLLHLVSALHPPLKIVRATIEAYPPARYIKSSNSGIIPLMIACGRNASPDVIKELLADGAADTISVSDSAGFSAIHWACREDASFAVLKQLLFVDPSAAASVENEPLDIIVQRRNKSIPKLSINQGTKLSLMLRARYYKTIQLDPQANSVLHAALALQAPWRILECSLQQILAANETQDASVASHRDCHGNLPLHYAVQRNLSVEEPDTPLFCKFVPDSIVTLFPEGASQFDSEGRLPLHEALKKGFTWTRGVQHIFESYPQANTLRDHRYNLYPFCLAAAFANKPEDVDTSFSLLRENPEIILC